MACDRYNSHDREACAIASGVLKDYGIITDGDKSQVIDRSKLRRERDKQQKLIQKQEKDNCKYVNALYFDGKKDATMIMAECNGKFYRRVEIEDRYVVVGEPGS